MAVNDTRSMNIEFAQGGIDSTYIALTPNRGGVVEAPPYDRMTWPTYGQAERHQDHPHTEAHIRQSMMPVEHKTQGARLGRGDGDRRY